MGKYTLAQVSSSSHPSPQAACVFPKMGLMFPDFLAIPILVLEGAGQYMVSVQISLKDITQLSCKNKSQGDKKMQQGAQM